MNETIEHLMTSRNAQERVCHWVEDVKEDESVASTETSVKRRLESESEEFVETDSEFDSVSECGGKRRRLGVPVKTEELDLSCEWRGCHFNVRSMDQFAKHVANHVPELEIKVTDDDEAYVCLWAGCTYESSIDVDIMRHVNYHAFHTKIKCLGSNVRKRIKVPKCHRNTDWKNILDSLPPHECHWEDCNGKEFNNYTMFLYHILIHIQNNPRGNKVEGGVNCLWKDCRATLASVYKLREHMRVHTKEKLIACPDCGSMFANNTKFNEHCKRQISLGAQGFQCCHCHKFYPTESILREHVRTHVFHYKCPLCDMSCDSPSGLAKHKLYRHTETRSFPCSMCTHAAKSQQDLNSHMTIHLSGSTYECNMEGCSYLCKNAYTLDRHVERVHKQQTRWYCCHECPMRYRKSYRLTKHLIDTHKLQWLKGHKRFQYVFEDDGCYRLQATRYEDICEAPAEKDPLGFENANISTDLDKEVSYSENNNEEPRKSMPTIPSILISIDEVDEHGNVIHSKLIETQETTELPPSAEPPIILT